MWGCFLFNSASFQDAIIFETFFYCTLHYREKLFWRAWMSKLEKCSRVLISHIYLLFTFFKFVRSRIYRFLVLSALILCTASMSLVGPLNAPYYWAPTKEHFRNIEDLYRYIQRFKTYKFFARHRFSRPRYLQKWKR